MDLNTIKEQAEEIRDSFAESELVKTLDKLLEYVRTFGDQDQKNQVITIIGHYKKKILPMERVIGPNSDENKRVIMNALSILADVEETAEQIYAFKSRGDQAYENDDFRQAFEYYKLFLNKYSDDTSVLQNVAFCFQKFNKYKEALDFHIAVHKLEPENAWNLRQIGFCLQQFEDFENALNAHLMSEQLQPSNLFNIQQISICYDKLGKKDKAFEYYKKVEELEPDNAQNLVNIAQYFIGKRDYVSALPIYQKVVDLVEELPAWALSEYADCLRIANNDYKSAITYYQQAEKLDSDNNYILGNLGWSFFVLGNLRNAERYLRKVLETNEEKQDLMNLGHVCLCYGDEEEAVTLYQDSIVKYKDSSEFLTGFDDDYQYLKPHNVSEEKYGQIKQGLIEYVKMYDRINNRKR